MRQATGNSRTSAAEAFARDGFVKERNVVSITAIEALRRVVAVACDLYRAGSELHRSTGSSLADYTRKFPNRNPGVAPSDLETEPYLLGSLAALDARFRDFLARRRLWELASDLLGIEIDAVVYHYAQVLRKPAHVGPALSWHRDYVNTYIATDGPYFVRLLVPLQAMSEANGGTGVVPGSHLIDSREVHRREELRRQGIMESTEGAIFPALAPGDVLAIHSKLLHGSGLNRSGSERDLLAVQYGAVDAVLLHQHDAEYLTMRNRRGFRTLP